ncbi:Succinate--CoA ligase [ADP-forming] subunit beta, mitochondrial [Aphelenchoides fujianensis]|nr:Succinate--CoA ligase [ADP-forming] subunit beta, mitochondrial [Aphelenchoides fujianensis]
MLRTVWSPTRPPEYQAKDLLRQNGCTVQKFFVVDAERTADEQFGKHDYEEYAVKAQIQAGGRGKGRFVGGPKDLGGVHITNDKSKAKWAAGEMLNRRLVTKQTAEGGVMVKRILVADSVPINRETYLAIVLDRQFNGPVVVASSAGGVDIEETAKTNPELIITEPVDVAVGITKGAVRADRREAAVQRSPIGAVFCIDAKINVDDNAKFRQAAIFDAADHDEGSVVSGANIPSVFIMLVACRTAGEERAHAAGLNYISLDGNIACLVNGAGLAMATMDLIKLHGGEPANFLDVGGGATVEQVTEAFRIITTEKDKVHAIFVNIFGGIMRCDVIASRSTRVEEANALLRDSNLRILTRDSLDEAAALVVQSANEANGGGVKSNAQQSA